MSKGVEMSLSKEARLPQTNRRPSRAVSEARAWSSEFGPASLGRIVAVGPDRRLYVDFPGNPGGPVVSLCLGSLRLDEKTVAGEIPVLLVFEHGDPARPIIVGTVEVTVPAPQEPEAPRGQTDLGRFAFGNGRHWALTVDEEITLVCGKSSLTLTKDGRITLRGVEIVSRASGNNKIRGASVNIN
jgi:hypothetical protein